VLLENPRAVSTLSHKRRRRGQGTVLMVHLMPLPLRSHGSLGALAVPARLVWHFACASTE
jgi:hypothetical protein